MVASWLCFQLEIRLIARFAVVTDPDGMPAVNGAFTMTLYGVLFILVVAVGGLLFFRKMTRRELLCSASVMVALNVVLGIISYKLPGTIDFIWVELTEWDAVVTQLLVKAGLGTWLSTAVKWLLPPYVFVLFGKKNA